MKKAIGTFLTAISLWSISFTSMAGPILPQLYVTQNNVNLRASASTASKSLGWLNQGDIMNANASYVRNVNGYNWYHGKMESGRNNGKTGYVVSSYISIKQ